jgi:hypothetical protein
MRHFEELRFEFSANFISPRQSLWSGQVLKLWVMVDRKWMKKINAGDIF